MTRKLRVGVIGGGIGGLALTAALAQQGFDVRIFERTGSFGEVGAGIQVTPNAVKVLEAMGLGDALRKVAFLPQAIVGRNWDTAKEIFRIPLAEECPRLYNAPFFHVHRADLHHLLIDQVPAHAATLATACVDVRQTGETAVARFEDGSEFEADLIVGADGVRSTVRSKLFGETAPGFTGNMCFRAVVPVEGDFDFVTPDSSFWLGPKSHVVTYYVRGGKAVNIVAVNETADWVEESWNAPSSREELLAAFEGWHPNLIQLFERVESVFKWGLFDRDPMPAWSRGRITLLGDAAHPMLPFLSQGAAMSIEDGYVLARSLTAHGSDVASALRDYEAERLPRTSRVQLESRERGRTYHLPTRFAQSKRDLIYQFKSWLNPHASGIQADWVYSYNATDFTPRVAAVA
ncbi:FAD binding domain protein [Paraburkholderia xenovorans LB400]|uniref:Salicylate 1-monooxygenase (NahW) n=1 Tax=Paraburkholderia xenovorans (strain LB400) TaxID=266265 RepID=Q13IF2_PARXL|nr:FAD-dependent monooxygenase [Paraburkholderia xenovorans]ABE36137.1 Salicylate 1-monooxygenase (NahW) [Paraburkholderia xenovorans LB400]AIP35072.1 FAD binding domain protein [Paraburkholderia xenovorans LB400]